MKKISFVIILPVLVIFLLAGCVKSPSVPVEQKPDVKPQIAEPVKPEPQKVEQATVVPQIPDSRVWGHLGKTRSGDTYYNKVNVTPSSGIISVSTYKILSDDYKEQVMAEVRKNDPEKLAQYQRYDHNIRVDEIDCQRNMYRVKETTDYDDQGNVLSSYQFKNEQWKSIPVLTGLDTLREKYCVYQKQPVKKKK